MRYFRHSFGSQDFNDDLSGLEADAVAGKAAPTGEQATRVHIPGEIAGNNTTTAVVQVGEQLTSQLENGADLDWIAVNLVAGTQYQFNLNGTGDPELGDSFLTLFSGAGVQLAFNDDANGGTFDSQIVFTATTTGVHYLQADGFDASYFGSYSLAVKNLSELSPVDALEWNDPAPSTINVYFVGGRLVFNDGEAMTTDAWTAFEIAQAELAFQNYENVANLTFTTVANPALADFFMVSTDDAVVDGVYGYWNVGGGQFTLGGVSYTLDGAGVFNNDEWLDGGLEVGGIDYITLLHEIGHGMGLAHPHDDAGGSLIMNGVTATFDDFGDFDLNQGVYTVMSYNDGWQTAPHVDINGNPPTENYGYQSTLMALDLAQLHQTYGANATFNNGDNTYALPGTNVVGTSYANIWDTGGVDEIVYGGSLAAVINLNHATLDYSATGGGAISFAAGIHGGFTIANGVVIENASGGNGADIITGNPYPNTLAGNIGNDDLFGGSGNDTLIGGLGADDLNGGPGTDTASYLGSNGVTVNLSTGVTLGGHAGGDTFISIENLIGTAFADELTGNTSNNVLSGGGGIDAINGSTGNDDLYGEAGNDTLIGGGGADDLFGGADFDTASYTNSATGVTINLETNSISGGDANGDTFSSIENLLGSTGNDALTGFNGLNVLNGNNGNDTLAGLGGADQLIGGNGTDTITYAASNAAVTVNIQAGTASGGHAAGDTLLSIENVIGSNFADNITGSTGANVLTGGTGNDTFNATNGNDDIFGGSGSDTMVGGAGADDFDGGTEIDWVYYPNSNGAVTVNLQTNTASGFHAAGDTFVSVENLFGSTFVDSLAGNGSTNVLNGFSNNDSLSGGGGSDTLLGGLGNDTLDGGAGNDALSGYLGNDIFAFSLANFGHDTIISFDNGLDKISLAGSGLTFGSFTVTASGPGNTLLTYVNGAVTNWINILGTTPGLIDASDFI